MRPIADVAADMGLPADALELYGRHKAKVPLEAFPGGPPKGKLVVVTAMTPTPQGEGKTTTAIGLVQGLARLGRKPILTIREPSLGPVFGIKGGGTGGGLARAMPDTEINLHFTGDAHAVASAHNLLAALADAAVHHRTVPDLEATGIEWRRVTNTEDRALRRIVSGLGGRTNSPLREVGFDIDAASEIMAVLALTTGYDDLRERLGRLLVGFSREGKAVTASDLNAVGSMMALLKDAIKPNLVQTLEGQPALVHTGPFGNIAHGCSSILADRLALACGDIVVTEAGFAADLGFEKLVHIKTRSGGHPPSAAVVVATVRALKWHGGVAQKELAEPNLEAVHRGMSNLEHAIGIVRLFGLPAVVAINRFPNDRPEEVEAVRGAARQAGAHAVAESQVYSQGGVGGLELAEAVVSTCEQTSELKYLYPLEASIQEKVEVLARQVYGAAEVSWDGAALRQARRFTDLGWGDLPICMAKTNLSISADPKMLGRPTDYTFPVVGLRASVGAGFLYPLAGEIQILPGLPRTPNAFRIDLDQQGNVIDLL